MISMSEAIRTSGLNRLNRSLKEETKIEELFDENIRKGIRDGYFSVGHFVVPAGTLSESLETVKRRYEENGYTVSIDWHVTGSFVNISWEKDLKGDKNVTENNTR